jgi:hypothetical protein
MATFTQDDIQKLQQQTNDSFNEIWMAKWNSEIPLPLNADDSKRRGFIAAKYQEKRWFSRRVSAARSNCSRRSTLSPSLATPLPPAFEQTQSQTSKEVSGLDDLVTFDSPSVPQPRTEQTVWNSLRDLPGLIPERPTVDPPEPFSSTTVFRHPAEHGLTWCMSFPQNAKLPSRDYPMMSVPVRSEFDVAATARTVATNRDWLNVF